MMLILARYLGERRVYRPILRAQRAQAHGFGPAPHALDITAHPGQV